MGRTSQWWFAIGSGFVVIQLWRQHRQVAFADGLMMAVAPDNWERLSPVTLPAEEPVTQLEINSSLPSLLFLQPIDDLGRGFRRWQATNEA